MWPEYGTADVGGMAIPGCLAFLTPGLIIGGGPSSGLAPSALAAVLGKKLIPVGLLGGRPLDTMRCCPRMTKSNFGM